MLSVAVPPPRVLLVEDDAATLGYLSALLRDWGYAVDEARSGSEALDCIRRNCPHVVISDLVMPGMSGLELLKALRAFDQCLIFFILLTGFGSVSSAVSAIVEGADECLLKPVDPQTLRDILRRHMIVIPEEKTAR